MIKESNNFSIINVNSEIEALLLEAKLINKYKPKYNSQLKDDKHPLYIQITNELYPRILTARKKQNKDSSVYFGPFPSSNIVKNVLYIVRKIFPYSNHKIGKKACIYSQIKLCNPCPNLIEDIKDPFEKRRLMNIYKRNVNYIKIFLSGNIVSVIGKLKNQMKTFSDKLDFETANEILKKIKEIEYITQPINPVQYYLENPNFIEDIHYKEADDLSKIIRTHYPNVDNIKKIECYDVAHLAGTSATASMVTFVNGQPEKKLYRHFRIIQKRGNDDIASIKEVAQRRFKNKDKLGFPDLILVDGGKAQLKVFIEQFSNFNVPIVSLAKREETLIFFLSDDSTYRTLRLKNGPAKYLLLRIRNEAHRFARRYHHILVRRMLISQKQII